MTELHKFQCILPSFLTAYNFFKASLCGYSINIVTLVPTAGHRVTMSSRVTNPHVTQPILQQIDKCTLPNIIPAYNFFKASLSGNKSIVAGR